MSTITLPARTTAFDDPTEGYDRTRDHATDETHDDGLPPAGAVPEATARVGATEPTTSTDALPSAAATEIPVEDAVRPIASTERQPGVTTDADDPDLGASTAEYAVIVLAAAAFGGVMAAVLSSDSVSGMLLGIIQKALAV